MDRLRARMAQIAAEECPALVIGDFNVIPEDEDVWDTRAMASDALMQPPSRDAYRRLINDGWTDALNLHHPRGGIWTFWDYQAGAWQRDHGFRIDHALLSPSSQTGWSAPVSTRPIEGARRPAITPHVGHAAGASLIA